MATNPKIAPNNKIIQVFLIFIKAEPECFPIFIIECSAPVMKSSCPNKTINVPIKKLKKIPLSKPINPQIKQSPTIKIRLKMGIRVLLNFLTSIIDFK